jgi:hypothetical protein
MRDLESALSFIFTREIVIKKILHKENLERFVGLLVQVILQWKFTSHLQGGEKSPTE